MLGYSKYCEVLGLLIVISCSLCHIITLFHFLPEHEIRGFLLQVSVKQWFLNIFCIFRCHEWWIYIYFCNNLFKYYIITSCSVHLYVIPAILLAWFSLLSIECLLMICLRRFYNEAFCYIWYSYIYLYEWILRRQ